MSTKTRLQKSLLITLLLLALFILLATIKTAGIDTAVKLPANEPQQTLALHDLHCENHTIPTRLSANGWFSFDIVGELCWTGDITGKTLQLLISGAGYGPVYWDFPYKPETYSYKRAALRQGYATFNYYRTGIGASDHPFGLLIDVDAQAYVLQQIIQHLQTQHALGPLVSVGHSLGSVIALAHAVHYPDMVAGLVLTGFIHNSNPAFSQAMRSAVDLAPLSDSFRGKIIDPTYMVSKNDTRATTFYSRANTEPLVPVVDELNRQTLTVGEVVSMIDYFGPQSKAIKVPTLILTGDEDFVVCGGKLNCKDHRAIEDYEQDFFNEQACLEITMLADTGHNINLHKNAPDNFRLILDWIKRRVGSACPAV